MNLPHETCPTDRPAVNRIPCCASHLFNPVPSLIRRWLSSFERLMSADLCALMVHASLSALLPIVSVGVTGWVERVRRRQSSDRVHRLGPATSWMPGSGRATPTRRKALWSSSSFSSIGSRGRYARWPWHASMPAFLTQIVLRPRAARHAICGPAAQQQGP